MRPVIVAVATAGALLALYNALLRLRRDRLFADTAPVRIRSAAQGYVKVSGRAVPAHAAPTVAPLSGRPCTWWSYEIARHESERGQNVNQWRTVERAASVELFMLVDDDEARCLVGPVSAEITATTCSVWYGEEPRPAGPPPAIAPPLRLGDWRYTEQLLDVGARLSVIGELRSHSEVGDVNRITQEKLRLWKQDQASLLARFDQDHDGRIDAAEWEAARTAAAQEAQAQVLSSDVARVSVICQPTNGEPFLIAPLSAAQLVRREKLFAAFYLALGIACVILIAWALKQTP
jgi:hypothetical protein